MLLTGCPCTQAPYTSVPQRLPANNLLRSYVNLRGLAALQDIAFQQPPTSDAVSKLTSAPRGER